MTKQTHNIHDAQVAFAELVAKADPERKTRYEPPQCSDARKAGDNTACKCPDSTHTIDGRFYDSGVSRPRCSVFDGFTRRRDGSVWLKPYPATPAKPTVVPKRTIENMAAASALGLAYWSEAPGANKIYAVDEDGHAHTLLLDRKNFKVEHYCSQTWRYDPVAEQPRFETKKRCPTTNVRDVSWAMPADEQAVMALNWTIEDAVQYEADAVRDPKGWGKTGWCSNGKHHRCEHRPGGQQENGVASSIDGTTYRCPCECHTTEKEAEMGRLTTNTAIHGPGKTLRTGTKTKTKQTPVSMGGLTAAERRAQKAGREAALAKANAESDERIAKVMADTRAKMEAEALVAAATPKPMGRVQARALLLHDPDYLGDITNEALVDLLDDESVKTYHARIRTELRVNRGLTQRKSA